MKSLNFVLVCCDDHCDKNFVLKDDLRVHERIHIREKPFKCHHCDKTFVQNDDLRVHERLHTGEKPFNCHHCDKKFVQKDNLFGRSNRTALFGMCHLRCHLTLLSFEILSV